MSSRLFSGRAERARPEIKPTQNKDIGAVSQTKKLKLHLQLRLVGYLTNYTADIWGNLTENFPKSQMPGGFSGGAWAVLN